MRKTHGLFFLCIAFAKVTLAADADGDGMDDAWELAHGLNPNHKYDAQRDPDRDGLTSLEEFGYGTNPVKKDSDRDWIKDGDEINIYGSNPLDSDSDGDSIGDFFEVYYNLDPNDPADAETDTDGDSLTASQEINNCRSNPNQYDTDGDQINDGLECLTYGTAAYKNDTDGDGISDYDELFVDEDEDGLNFHQEITLGTDPLNPDTDGDYMPDGWEDAGQLNPLDGSDGNLDLDYDGFSAYEEFRLGSDPADTFDVPPYLNNGYVESFEQTDIPLWIFPEPGTAPAWQRSCVGQPPVDGSCLLYASQPETAVTMMARFPNGTLVVPWKAWSQNGLRVLIDGSEVFAYTGATPTWTNTEIEIADGVHEVTFVIGSGSGYNLAMIDAVSFNTDPLSVRPANLSCLAPPVSETDVDVAIEYPFPEIPYFDLATKIIQPPGDPSRWFVLEKYGLIKTFDVLDPADVRVYLDFSDDIMIGKDQAGLLGMTFDPDFPAVPEIYVTYVNAANDAVLSRIVLDDPYAPVNPVEQVLIQQPHTRMHYGGEVNFGPDEMLYVSYGDDNKKEWAQDTTNLYGALVRIDVRGVDWPSPGYNIPSGNPFPASNEKCGPTSHGPQDCPELFAWGFRHPYRWSVDMPTGDIYVGDVGANSWEEVSLVEAGGNYGWPCYEGRHLTGDTACGVVKPEMLPPLTEYSHDEGRAIIGGVVYRGDLMPSKYGRYIFADLGIGPIWELLPDGLGGFVNNQIQTSPRIITNLVAGADNEIYFVVYFSPDWNPNANYPPVIGKLVPADGGNTPPINPIPDKLSESGCVDSDDPSQTLPGVIPYDINALFWSDYADKERFMAIPDGTTIDVDANDDWVYPAGTVLLKHFRLNGQLVETRLMMKPAGSGDRICCMARIQLRVE